jgi:hypothetical protein
MAVQSYLSDAIGGMVAAAAFSDDDAATAAVDALHSSGIRAEDISVIAPDAARAASVARDVAWTPRRRAPAGRLARIVAALPRPGGGVPRELRKRFRTEMGDGHVVVVVAAGGQPADTLQALLRQAGGTAVQAWWMKPAAIFAPPELAGPF